VPIPRSATLIAVVTSLVLVGVAQGSVAQQSADPIQQLRRQADQARAALEKATQQLGAQQGALAKSEAKLRDTLKALAVADASLNRIRGPLARLAGSAYESGGTGGDMSVFTDGDPDDALRSAALLDHIATAQDYLIHQAAELREQQSALASTAAALQEGNTLAQTKIQQQVTVLRQESARLTQQLTQLLVKAGGDAGLAAACDPALVAPARKFPNGLIPAAYLCPLPEKGMKLRADAALAFYRLNAAYWKRFGHDMCLTYSYRSLAEQQHIYAATPALAAVPGRSNHGLGTAIDVCDGVQNQGSPQFNWLLANSRQYQWFHPAWAYVNPFEPWHWEFMGEKTLPGADPVH
jgi:LAS superfamily LD-carboxypeptidase LdcB